jgi:hypothetical protein
MALSSTLARESEDRKEEEGDVAENSLRREDEISPDRSPDPEDPSSKERRDGNERISRLPLFSGIVLSESCMPFLDLIVPDETPMSFR